MVSDKHHPGGIGNHSGLLGRYYMGHISGRIARIQFHGDPQDTAYGFLRDRDGVYARARFTFSREFQHRERLTNIVAWLVNPDEAIADLRIASAAKYLPKGERKAR